MPILVGTLRNSADRVLPTARLTITLTTGIVDINDTPDSTLLPVAAQFIVTNGALATAQFVNPDGTLASAGAIDLLASTNFGVPYRFTLEAGFQIIRFYTQDGVLYSAANDPSVTNPPPYFQHTDTKWYTGSEFVVGVSRLLTRIVSTDYVQVDDFYAMVPNQADVEYSLIRKSGLTSTLDDSVYLVAETLTTDPVYLARLSGRITVRGQYNPATFYSQNDVVVRGSVLSVYINASSTAGNAPPQNVGESDTAFWAKLPNLTVSPTQAQDLSGYVLKAGDTMTGPLLLPALGGSPNTASAVRLADGDVRYARLGSSGSGVTQTIFGDLTISATGTLVVPPRTATDNTSNAASTAFVNSFWNGNRYDRMVVAAARAAAQSLTFNVMNKITWDSIFVNLNESGGVYLDNAGVFTIRVAGWHRIFVVVEYNNTTGVQAGGILRLQQTTAPVTSIKMAQATHVSSASPCQVILTGTTLFNFVGGAQFEIQFQPQIGSGTHTIVGDANTTRIFVFRQLI